MVQQPQDVDNRENPRAFGVMFHTTGRGVLDRAKEWGLSPLKAAEQIYTRKGASFAHYILGQDGTLLQVADELEHAAHTGIPRAQREQYMSGAWTQAVKATTLQKWQKRWPGFKSPSHLYPTTSPNSCYIGVEFIPDNNAEFSAAQYAASAALVVDIATRHKFLAEMRNKLLENLASPRLVGHEDIEPLERWNKMGGWDPGALRDAPKFVWANVTRRIKTMSS
jgi:N-acetyl-anhydromuramyl-L-alanine amidase AmpD